MSQISAEYGDKPRNAPDVWDRPTFTREVTIVDTPSQSAVNNRVPNIAWVKEYVSGTGGGGAVTGASNLGNGRGIFAQKDGAVLELKSLEFAGGLSSTADGDEITISGATLQSAIAQEVTDRGTAVSAEATTRGNADTTLQTNINAKAPIASPTFTGVPAAPTAAPGTDTTQLSTTAFVKAAVDAAITAIRNGVDGSLDTLAEIATALGLKAPSASPTFTGTPAAPTAADGTNTTQVATTAFVTSAVANGLTAIRNGVASGLDTLAEIATELALKATIASPTLTGTPAAPTAADGTNTTQLATTAFVTSAVTNALAAIRNGVAAGLDTLAEIATELALKATLASPALTGTPTAPTAVVATDNTQLATTAFVHDVVADEVPAAQLLPDPTGLPDGKVAVTSSGAWVADDPTSDPPLPAPGAEGDVLTVVSGDWASAAPSGAGLGDFSGPASSTDSWPVVFNGATGKLGKMPTDAATFRSTIGAVAAASPAFSGTPTAPTPSALDNSTKLATTAYADAAVAAQRTVILGGATAAADTLGELETLVNGKAAASHTHDDRYYTEAEADALLLAKANLAGATDFTGNPIISSTILASTDSSTKIATTAWVQSVITALKNGVSGAFDTLAEIATELALKAPIASPTFTGTPASVTPAAADDTTKIATTAWLWLNEASAANIWAKTTKKVLTAVGLWDAAAYVSLTDASTVTLNQSNGINFDLLATSGVGATRTLGAMSNAKPGSSGVIRYRQDASGSRALVLTNFFKWDDETIAIDTTTNAVQHLFYFVDDASTVILSLRKKRVAIT